MPEGASIAWILVGSLPWVLACLATVFLIREPRPLPPGPGRPEGPSVSIVVPARNEARSIGECVRSLLDQRYRPLEVIVVDDRSDDDTSECARRAGRGDPALRVVEGTPLPDGWMGKPWACAQGAGVATGTVLLFVDADTTHGPDLLPRALVALEDDDGDALTLLGRQLTETFWERLVQPQIFTMLMSRFRRLDRPVGPGRCTDAIANGQYLMFRREVYDEIGGHAAVRSEVVEDQALAQRLCRSGKRLALRAAEDELATRMYRSLAELTEGWSKNIAIGARDAVPLWARPFALPGMVLVLLGLWVVPALVGVAAWIGWAGPTAGVWAGVVVGLGVLYWAGANRRYGIPIWYALAYPIGAAVTAAIVARSGLRGRRVEWKGRKYTVPTRDSAQGSSGSPGISEGRG